MPWGMKIGGLKPGAKETITDKKLKTFVVGKQKKSRLQKVCAKTPQMIHKYVQTTPGAAVWVFWVENLL